MNKSLGRLDCCLLSEMLGPSFDSKCTRRVDLCLETKQDGRLQIVNGKMLPVREYGTLHRKEMSDQMFKAPN